MTLPEAINKMKELLKTASPGEWQSDLSFYDPASRSWTSEDPPDPAMVHDGSNVIVYPDDGYFPEKERKANLELIAIAHNCLPAMIAITEAAEVMSKTCKCGGTGKYEKELTLDDPPLGEAPCTEPACLAFREASANLIKEISGAYI